MNKIIDRLIASNFAELQGLQITGTIPVKQEILNEALADVLANGLPAPGTAAPAAPAAGAPAVNVNDLLKLVTKAEITAHEGEIRLEFEIRR